MKYPFKKLVTNKIEKNNDNFLKLNYKKNYVKKI